MAPSLALLAKRQFPLPCQAIIQEYAADKRAPHAVALLVKSINVGWGLSLLYNEVMTIDFDCKKKWKRFYWRVDALKGDGIFTIDSVEAIEENNKRQIRDARHDADARNSWVRRPNIHSCLLRMHQEMQGCRFLPGSVTSCPDLGRLTPRSYLNEAWATRGWDKRGSKRKRWQRSNYRLLDIDSDLDSE